jgi:thiol-disulfide isomerase/thioredoxin
MRSFRPLLAALVLGGCAANTLPPLTNEPRLQRSRSALGSEPKPLTFTVARYPEGPSYSLAEDRGQVVMIDVWATWCEPCRDAMPMAQDLAKHYAARGLKVYALNVDADPRGIAAFLAETKVSSLPVLLDANADVADKVLRVRGMPTTVLIDRQGLVRYTHEGFNEDFLQQYQTELEELLAEPAKRSAP